MPLSNRTLCVRESCAVFVLTHAGKWLSGTVTRYGVPHQPPGSRFALRCKGIKGGTSGGPVVTGDGRLLGVISWSGTNRDDSSIPVAHLALPFWVLEQIRAGDNRRKLRPWVPGRSRIPSLDESGS